MLMMFGAMDNRRMCIGNRSRTRNRYFVTHEVRALEAQKTPYRHDRTPNGLEEYRRVCAPAGQHPGQHSAL